MLRQRLKKDLVLALAILLLLAAVGLLQRGRAAQLTAQVTAKLNYLPTGAFLKGLALGYDEALADLLWVGAVGYFGEHAKSDRDYTWLTHMLRLVTELDPLYESPYEFAGVILPSELDDVDGAIAFLQQGRAAVPRHNPRYWLQPFYLGFCHLIYKNEPLAAAPYFAEAAAFPQSPAYLKLLATRAYASAGQADAGIAVIDRLLGDSQNELTQNEAVRESLLRRRGELQVSRHIQLLEQAAADYRRLFGRPPERLRDLLDDLVLPLIPAEPFGGYYYLAFDGAHVLSSVAGAGLAMRGSHYKEKRTP